VRVCLARTQRIIIAERIAPQFAASRSRIHCRRATRMHRPELVPDEILEKSGAAVARAAFAHLPVAKPAQLAADAIIVKRVQDSRKEHRGIAAE